MCALYSIWFDLVRSYVSHLFLINVLSARLIVAQIEVVRCPCLLDIMFNYFIAHLAITKHLESE